LYCPTIATRIYANVVPRRAVAATAFREHDCVESLPPPSPPPPSAAAVIVRTRVATHRRHFADRDSDEDEDAGTTLTLALARAWR